MGAKLLAGEATPPSADKGEESGPERSRSRFRHSGERATPDQTGTRTRRRFIEGHLLGETRPDAGEITAGVSRRRIRRGARAVKEEAGLGWRENVI
jgi:hypothetical protein